MKVINLIRGYKVTFCLVILLLILLAGFTFIVHWLSVPRSSPYIINFLTKKIESHVPDSSVKISDCIIERDKQTNLLNFKIYDLTLTKIKANQDIVKLPKLEIQIDLPALFIPYKNVLQSLTINSPEIQIEPELKTEKPITISKITQYLKRFSHIHSLIVENGQIKIIRPKSPINISFNLSSLNTAHDSATKAHAQISIGKQDAALNFESLIPRYSKVNPAKYYLNLTKIPLSILSDWNENAAKPQTLAIDSLLADIEIFPSEAINIKKLDLELNNGGKIKAHTTSANVAAHKVNLDIVNFSIDSIHALWPEWLVPNVRLWFTSNINQGKISKGAGHFMISKEMLQHQTLPTGSIDASLELEGITLHYYPGLPEIRNISGVAKFNDNSLTIDASSGEILNSHIVNAQVKIPLLDPHNNLVTINGTAKGAAANLIEYIPEDKIARAKKDNIDLRAIKGSAITDVDIKIPLIDDIYFEDIKFNIQSKLNAISLSHLPDNTTLTYGNFAVMFDGKQAEVTGQSRFDNNPTTIKWVGYLEAGSKYDTELKLDSILLPENRSKLKWMGYKVLTNGKIAATTDFTTKGELTTINIYANLNEAELSLASIGFTKPIGIKTTFKLAGTISDEKTIKINNFSLNGDNILIQGSGELSKALLLPNRINFAQVKFARNDFSASYKSLKRGYEVAVNGASIDFRNADFSKFFTSSSDSTGEQMIKLSLEHALMKNNIVFHHVRGLLQCSIIGCLKANLGAIINNEDILSVKLAPLSSHDAEVVVDSTDASAVANAFDIYKNIKGGILNIKANKHIESDNAKSTTKGQILIKNFTAIKTPILAKLLTFSSLPGIIKLLGGNHIPFTEFKTGFSYSDNILNLHDGQVRGHELGLTMEGSVNFTTSIIDIDGTIIPDLYFINKAISSIPLIGFLLQGGKKGEGMFAANYRVYGNFDKVDTFVNPISMLTPGFLRRIFDIFDSNKNTEPAK